MTYPTVRDFVPEDLLEINPVDEVKALWNGHSVLQAGEKYKKLGPCFTGTIDGKPIASGGLIKMWKGTAEMWFAIDRNSPPGVVIGVKLQLGNIIEENELDRVQAITPESWQTGKRFLEWLGFQQEGILRKMGPHGITQILYARVK
jgi:hypothetical protein